MPNTAEAGISKFFEQTMEQFSNAMKVGAKMQEEYARWVAEMMGQWGSVQEWQKRSRAVFSEAIPTAQKSAEEYLRLFDQGYRASMDLVKKAVDSGRSETAAEAQAKGQELLEQYMSALRSNAQAMAQANVKAMESWSEFLRKNFDYGNGVAARAAATA